MITAYNKKCMKHNATERKHYSTMKYSTSDATTPISKFTFSVQFMNDPVVQNRR